MLKALERGLGAQRAATFQPQHLVAYATMRREEGAGPYTINMDVSKLGTVMRYAGASLNVALPDVVGAARRLLTHLRLIGGGGKRERRPTEEQLGVPERARLEVGRQDVGVDHSSRSLACSSSSVSSTARIAAISSSAFFCVIFSVATQRG